MLVIICISRVYVIDYVSGVCWCTSSDYVSVLCVRDSVCLVRMLTHLCPRDLQGRLKEVVSFFLGESRLECATMLIWRQNSRLCTSNHQRRVKESFVLSFFVGESRGGRVVPRVWGEADLARDLSGFCFAMLFWFVTVSLELDHVTLVCTLSCTLSFSCTHICTYTYTYIYMHAHWCHANDAYSHENDMTSVCVRIHETNDAHSHVNDMCATVPFIWHQCASHETVSHVWMTPLRIYEWIIHKCAMISFMSRTEVLVVESIWMLYITHTHSSSSSPQVVHSASFASSIWKKHECGMPHTRMSWVTHVR